MIVYQYIYIMYTCDLYRLGYVILVLRDDLFKNMVVYFYSLLLLEKGRRLMLMMMVTGYINAESHYIIRYTSHNTYIYYTHLVFFFFNHKNDKL